MLDCCVARERLRIVMSSIMRWRRGRVVAIGASCPERGGCDHHILSDGRFHRNDLPAAPKEQVRSIPGRIASESATYGDVLRLLGEAGLPLPRAPVEGREDQIRRAHEWMFPKHVT